MRFHDGQGRCTMMGGVTRRARMGGRPGATAPTPAAPPTACAHLLTRSLDTTSKTIMGRRDPPAPPTQGRLPASRHCHCRMHPRCAALICHVAGPFSWFWLRRSLPINSVGRTTRCDDW